MVLQVHNHPISMDFIVTSLNTSVCIAILLRFDFLCIFASRLGRESCFAKLTEVLDWSVHYLLTAGRPHLRLDQAMAIR